MGGKWVKIEKRDIEVSKRFFGADVVKTIAVFFVPTIHFFGMTGYYDTPMNGKLIFFMSFLRWISVCAVPLFMILTGYFKINKKIDINNYKAIVPILLTHIFISSIRIIVDYKIHNIDVDVNYIIDKLIYFEYGWYVELYIGMVLFLPFFNIIYNSLSSRKEKEILIITFILFSSVSDLTFNIVPRTWLILYVFMYYFIGAYIREYNIKINRFIIFIIIVFILFFVSYSMYVKCDTDVFDWNFYGYISNSGYSSIPVVMLSVLITLFFINIKCDNKFICGIFKSISTVSLEMYLLSQMFDEIIYKMFTGYSFADFASKVYIIIPTIIFLSYLASSIKKVLFIILAFIYKISIGKLIIIININNKISN